MNNTVEFDYRSLQPLPGDSAVQGRSSIEPPRHAVQTTVPLRVSVPCLRFMGGGTPQREGTR